MKNNPNIMTGDIRFKGKGGLMVGRAMMCACVFMQTQTHVSTGESRKQFELIWWIAFGGHKVEKDLELATAQETPLQELSAGRPDTQFTDWFPDFLIGLWR